MRLVLLLICLALPVALLASVAAADGKTPEGGAKLPKLFNFDAYRQLFSKNYRTLSEEMSRRRLYFAHALRAFVTGVKYKLRLAWHYNAVNHMSDWLPEELARMRNKRMAAEFRRKNKQAAGQEKRGVPVLSRALEMPEFIAAEDEDVEGELVDLMAKHSNEPGYAELRAEVERRRRRRRDVADQLALPPRDFSLDQLIKSPDNEQEEPEVRAKIKRHVKSNNPNYHPIALEMTSFGLSDQQEDVMFHQIYRTDWRPIGDQLAYSLSSLSNQDAARQSINNNAGEAQAQLVRSPPPDEVFVDHRKSNCMLKPRDQGRCGACYAFASTALMEWLYCVKTGKLVPFSEQYIIDCGNDRFGNLMSGCEGSEIEPVASFWANFGLELRVNYPYRGRNQSCPYHEDFDLKKTGYVRMDYEDASIVHQRTWESHIVHAPIYVGIKSPEDFEHFGGGIDDGELCTDEPDHAMLLIGHGREDGLEYWILRNSFSSKWGEGGYYRLAKHATSRCLDKEGLMIGTSDGKNFPFEALHTGLGQPEKRENYATKIFNFFTGASSYDQDTV